MHHLSRLVILIAFGSFSLLSQAGEPMERKPTPKDQNYILDSPSKSWWNSNHGQIIHTFEIDGFETEWVELSEKEGRDRFIGYLYLQDALAESKSLANVRVAEHRLGCVDGKILYLSRRIGERRVEFGTAAFKALFNLKKIGFSDLGFSTVRLAQEGKEEIVVIVNTDLKNFDPSRRIQIYHRYEEQYRKIALRAHLGV